MFMYTGVPSVLHVYNRCIGSGMHAFSQSVLDQLLMTYVL